MEDHGKIIIKLDALLKESGLSKNKLSHRAEMQRSQINSYCRNEITRLDVDVLARICNTLGCNLNDLLEYVPPADKESKES